MANDIEKAVMSQLPAHIRKRMAKQNVREVVSDLTEGAGGGFPVLSIKGKVFTVVRGGESTVLMNPKDPDTPASYIDCVLVRANRNISKTFYLSEYVEGSDNSPDCSSADGVAPDPGVPSPQSPTCAACPHNQWGSRITENGKKGKRCADHRRVAVASPDAIEDPMLLRVPPTSLKPLAEYGKALAARGLDYRYVLTRIRFLPEAAVPVLEFRLRGFLSEEQCEQVDEMYESETVRDLLQLREADIVGGVSVAGAEASSVPIVVEDEDDDDDEDEPPAKKKPKARKPKAEKPKAEKPKAEPVVVVEDEDDDDDDSSEQEDSILASLDPEAKKLLESIMADED